MKQQLWLRWSRRRFGRLCAREEKENKAPSTKKVLCAEKKFLLNLRLRFYKRLAEDFRIFLFHMDKIKKLFLYEILQLQLQFAIMIAIPMEKDGEKYGIG